MIPVYYGPSHKISIYKPSPSLYPVSSAFSCRNAMLWRERNHCEWQIALPSSMLVHVSLMSKHQMTSLPLFWQETLGTLEFINEMVTRMPKKRIRLTSKTTTLLMHHTCLYSSLPFLPNYAWQCQILHFRENVNKHWQNLFFSFYTWIWSLRIQPQ